MRQLTTSIPKLFFMSAAHCESSRRVVLRSGLGTSFSRPPAFPAITPKYRIVFLRGLGTSEARRPMNALGVRLTWVEPSRHGRLSSMTTRLGGR